MYKLNGTVIRIVSRLDGSYPYDVQMEEVKIGDSNSSQFVFQGGFGAHVFLALQSYLNFSYELVVGSESLTRRFDLANNYSIDLFAASYDLFDTRAEIVDPTFVIGSSRLQVYLNSEFDPSREDLIFAPFHYYAWACVISAAAAFSVAMSALVVLKAADGASMRDAVYQILAVFALKDANIVLRSTPARVLIIAAAATSMLLVAMHSSSVVSLLTIQRKFMDSLGKILSSDYDINFSEGATNISSIYSIARALKRDSEMELLFQKVSESKFHFQNFVRSFEEVESRPLAYIIDEETAVESIETTLGYSSCKMIGVSFRGVRTPWSMYLRKGSRFRPAINYGLLKLMETGHINCFSIRWIPGKRRSACSNRRTDQEGRGIAVELRHLRSIFLLLGSTGLVALFMVGIEHVSHLFDLNRRRIIMTTQQYLLN